MEILAKYANSFYRQIIVRKSYPHCGRFKSLILLNISSLKLGTSNYFEKNKIVKFFFGSARSRSRSIYEPRSSCNPFNFRIQTFQSQFKPVRATHLPNDTWNLSRNVFALFAFCSVIGLAIFNQTKGKHVFIFDSVSAITPNMTGRNFIADVVDKAAPAVVFLEIKGT